MNFFKKLMAFVMILSLFISCSINPQIQQTTTTSFTSISTNLNTSNTTTTLTSTSTSSTSTITTTGKNDSIIPEEDEGPLTDPYVDVSESEFYANYTPATNYKDSYYRSLHYFMSGSIDEQDQEPTLAEYQPMENGLYVRNTSALYSEDGNTYYVIDSYGNIVNKIFKGGAYVTLEEVAAYVFAFGDIPVNYDANKKAKPTTSPWGKYLRVNNTYFSGNTSKYPYEPVLPDISGCGGSLDYYEIDIGTTGTDCDPSYTAAIYNNGTRITRGAARIVYTRYDKNGDMIIDLNEKYLFYTYNHYNDFQEYLNYEGGWGEMFGNITGGGTISSKYDYNPTPYVQVVRRNLYEANNQNVANVNIVEIAFIYFDKKYFYEGTFCA